MDKCSVQVYDRAIELLKRSGLVREDNHLLTAVEPK
jgi:hypothetical protein